jgi:poly(U)-specific endoribonuclease
MDSQIEQFYHRLYTTGDDVSFDPQESNVLYDFLKELNPPPDKLTKLRATAFKVACQHLSNNGDDDPKNVQLLRTIDEIVHAIEEVCMEPKEEYRSNRAVPVDVDAYTSFFNGLLDDDTQVDVQENEHLVSFFKETNPKSSDALKEIRTLAFQVGTQHLTNNNNTNSNEQVLRCINVIVHALEMTCYQPKPFHIRLSSTQEVSNNAPDDLTNMNLSQAAQQMWNYDMNRLTMDDDIVLNVQNGKKPYIKEDGATDVLITKVDPNVWQRPTYASFVHLLDNYVASTSTTESISNTERDEIHRFLDQIMETAPMQFCHQYCIAHGKATADRSDFIQLLHSIWFELYGRDGKNDSSGFEHVFIGEIDDQEISGFHNWVQFYLQEKKGFVDYRGYIKPRGHGQAHHGSNDYILTLQFAWKNQGVVYAEKFVGTMFIGVSPEFEMALYTMCFLCGEDENSIELDTGLDVYQLVIKCYKMARGKIGTTFPEVSAHYEDDDDN